MRGRTFVACNAEHAASGGRHGFDPRPRMRGRTPSERYGRPGQAFYKVSIHAPACGGDWHPEPDAGVARSCFDPRPRMGGGVIERRSEYFGRQAVSIHAPACGGELAIAANVWRSSIKPFRSTPPHAGANPDLRIDCPTGLGGSVSIHAPAWGRTAWTSCPARYRSAVSRNPRPRMRGRHQFMAAMAIISTVAGFIVSIHAPACGGEPAPH